MLWLLPSELQAVQPLSQAPPGCCDEASGAAGRVQAGATHGATHGDRAGHSKASTTRCDHDEDAARQRARQGKAGGCAGGRQGSWVCRPWCRRVGRPGRRDSPQGPQRGRCPSWPTPPCPHPRSAAMRAARGPARVQGWLGNVAGRTGRGGRHQATSLAASLPASAGSLLGGGGRAWWAGWISASLVTCWVRLHQPHTLSLRRPELPGQATAAGRALGRPLASAGIGALHEGLPLACWLPPQQSE